MANLLVNTVYETYASKRQAQGGDERKGSLTIIGGTIDIAFSNSETEPTDSSTFALDANGSNVGGVVEIAPAAKWMFLTVNTGSPVVQDFRVV